MCRPEGLGFSFNGGKDSTLLLHLLLEGVKRWRREQGGSWNETDGLMGIHTFFFESEDEFPEVISFVKQTNEQYHLHIATYTGGFKEGLSNMLKQLPVKGIFLGTRHGDPNCKDQVRCQPGHCCPTRVHCVQQRVLALSER
jgi:FAD synthetase